MKLFNLVSASVLSSLLLTVVSTGVQAQTSSVDKKQAAKEQCEIVMRKVAINRGVNFGGSPCENNVYPLELWTCVDKKVTAGDDFDLSVRRCERRAGLR